MQIPRGKGAYGGSYRDTQEQKPVPSWTLKKQEQEGSWVQAGNEAASAFQAALFCRTQKANGAADSVTSVSPRVQANGQNKDKPAARAYSNPEHARRGRFNH